MSIGTDTATGAAAGTSIVPGIGTAIGAGAGAIMGLIQNAGADNRQYNQQKRLQDLQIQGSEDVADYNQQLGLDTWQKTGYVGQVQQAEKANLNPALIYGGNGGGGATTGNQGGSVTGATASDAASRDNATTNLVNTISTMGLTLAQTQLAEANKEKVTTEIPKIQADTSNTKANTENTEAQTTGQNIQNTLDQGALSNRLSTINSNANKALEESMIAFQNSQINQGTMEAQITKIKQDAINSTIQEQVMQQGIKVDQATINNITNSIQQKWKQLDLEQQNQGAQHTDREQAITQFTKTALEVAGIQAASQTINNVIGIATKSPSIPHDKDTHTYDDGEGTISKYERYLKQ